jgi:hypothetical protein
VLNVDEFVAFFRLLESNRPEVEEVFKKYSTVDGGHELSTKDLGHFFATEQGVDLNQEQTKSLIAAYEKSELKSKGLLSKNGAWNLHMNIDYRCDNRRFWLSARNCQVPTPTSQNMAIRTAISDF